MDKLRMKSADVVDGNVAKIAALFPNCVTETASKVTDPDGKERYESRYVIDFEKLRAELSKDAIDAGEERYQFTWPDKRAASRLANTPTDKTLRPDVESSVDFWNTQNLYIEGDNLEVLKILREDYLGKVKMIYIDPPYNTGNDFVYNDDFAQGKDDFEATSGLFDEDGNQVIDPMQRNTESNGRFHTDWLNMIYPRLKVARDLLSEDGVIFISIDDNEVDNLKKVCDEIFGERNFIANIIWQSTPGSNTGVDIITVTENILVFAKEKSLAHINMVKIKDDSKYVLSDSHEQRRGKYVLNKLDRRMTGPHYSEALNYPIIAPDGSEVYPGGTPYRGNENWNYRWSEQKVQWGIENDFIIFKKVENKWNIYFKQYFKVDNNDKLISRSVPYQNLILSNQFNTTQGTASIFTLFGNKFFDYAKPIGLICHFLCISSEPNDIILDFFSGSATTAHAVMNLNAEDEGHRKFIMVQLPEMTDEKSEARKAGYKTICQIGEERIRRAGKELINEIKKAEKPFINNDKNLFEEDSSLFNTPDSRLPDVGFRVLKLDSSNMEQVFYTPEAFDAKDIFTYVDNVKTDRSPLDLLFQVMPELNIELSAKIEEKDINGKKVFFVDDTYLIATFDTDVNESTITEIAKMKPVYFVMRDGSATNDNLLDNFEQIFKHYSPDTTRRIL